jgi:CHAT domain-containing protein
LLEDRVLTESHGTKEVRELADQLQQARQRLTQLSPTVLRHEFRWQQSTNQKALCAEIEALQAMLARQVAGLGRARRALSIRLEDVQAAIPEGTVLLEMLRYRHGMGEKAGEERYGTLIISRHEEPQWICLGGADEIEKTLKIHQHAVRNSATPEPLVHSLTELYRHVWAPLAAHLPVDSKRIIISPDGGLNFVSFATLLAPDKSFLCEQYSFGYVSCGRDLTAEAPASLSRDLLVWANPDFDASLTASSEDGGTIRSAELRGLDFRPLPGAEKEGRDLFRRASALGFTNSALHLGRAATEEQLLQVRSPKVLHLATHGFLFPPMNAVTERNFASDLGVRDAQSSSTDPMLCSGLALAGARLTLQLWAEGKETSARNDGILTADDIGVLDLRRTWLVVLSACDTGLGEARGGEGVFGLRRGFTQAGAQNLLLTLWPIDDERTRDLISDFYTQLEICASPANALADVQRKWLKRLRAEGGIAEACRIAGPFILSFQGKPGEHP